MATIPPMPLTGALSSGTLSRQPFGPPIDPTQTDPGYRLPPPQPAPDAAPGTTPPTAESTQGNLALFEQAFRATADAVLPTRIRAGAITAAILLGAFAIVDLYTLPRDVTLFRALVRFIFTPAYIAIALAAPKLEPGRAARFGVVALASSLAMEISLLGIRMPPSEGAGFFLAMLFISSFLPLPRPWLIGQLAAFPLSFLALQVAFTSHGASAIFQQFMGIVGAALVAGVSAELAERLRRSEFAANTRLADSNRRLRELDRFKSQFYAAMSQELRTPLSSAILSLEDAAAASPPSRADAGHETFRAAMLPLQHLRGLVEELLELTQLDAGFVRPTAERTDLGAVVRALAHEFAPAFESRTIDLRVKLPDGPARTPIGRAALEKIVINLLANALRYAPPSGEVRVTVAVGNGAATLEVRDDGPGLTEEVRARIFDRYFRAQPTSGGRGASIGLALAKELTELHGGSIRCLSALGSGTAFQVRWPLARVEAGYVSPDPEGTDPGRRRLTRDRVADIIAGALDGTGAVALPRVAIPAGADLPTVLVVEEHVELAHRIAAALEPGVRCILAHDGEAALAKMRDVVPDLVVCDLLLPQLDGLQLIGRMRADPRLMDSPVLLLTALADQDQVISALRAGADDYVLKPFERELLRVRVEALLRLRKRREARAGQRRLNDAACGHIAVTVDVECTAILTPDTNGMLTVLASGGSARPPTDGWGTPDAAWVKAVFAAGKAFVLPEPPIKGLANIAAAPLVRDGQPVGVVVAMNLTHPKEIPAQALRVLDSAAGYLGLQVNREQMLGDLARRAEEKRQLLEAVLQGQDQERRRLALDLHDGTGQVLVGALLHLDVALTSAATLSVEQVTKARALVDSAIQEIRALSRDLHPPTLAQLGLCRTVRDLAETLRSDHLAVTTDVPEELGVKLKPEAAIGLYRIAQAAIANAVRHAHARSINMGLGIHDASIQLSVEDDGTGFVPTDTAVGVGMLSMKERAASLGGQLSIDSVLGRGTRVLATIPLELARLDANSELDEAN